MLSKFELMKGGISAKYGGRTSSVLNMQLKEGDFYEWGGKGSVNNLAGKITLGGPLVKREVIYSYWW